MRNKISLFLILFCLEAFGSDEVEKLLSLQKSLARDFLIYELLQKPSTTSIDALKMYELVYRKNPKLEQLFHKKITDKEFNYEYDCKNMDKTQLLAQNNQTCKLLALNPTSIQNLSHDEQLSLYDSFEKEYKDKLSWYKLMLEKDTFNALLKANPKEFLKVFLGTPKEYRYEFLDKNVSDDFLKRLADTKGFDAFILDVVMDKNYKNLPIWLLSIDAKVDLSYKGAFYLGILSLMHHKAKKADKFFKKSEELAQNPEFKDKALFWQYKSSGNKNAYEKLLKSEYFDFYSLYAKQKSHKNPFSISFLKPTKKSVENYSFTDPFTWEYTKKVISKMDERQLVKFSKKFFTKETLPYYVYMLQRVHKWKKNYFITPYEKYIENLSDERKTLIYAIARQESRCIPVDVSTSYALGMMQFMPFLAKLTAKDMEFQNFKYSDMFKPKVALNFANYHLDYLQKNLKHPLFIAYGYNGGIGFATRLFTQKHLFKKGEYEPFLSMELIANAQAREYGKKVLSNYVIYAKMFGLKTTLEELLENLRSPF